MKIRKRWLIPLAALAGLGGLAGWGWWYIHSQQYEARRLAAELCNDPPTTPERWMVKLGLLEARKTRPPEEVVKDLIAVGEPAVEPLLAALGHSNRRVRMWAAWALVEIAPQDVVDRLPVLMRQAAPHHPRDLPIPLQQFQRDPLLGVGVRHAPYDQCLNLLQDLLVIGPDLGRLGCIGNLSTRHPVDGLHQLPHAYVLGSDHWNHGYPQRCLQHLWLDLHALLLRHVHHVQSHDHRDGQGKQLRDQIQAPL